MPGVKRRERALLNREETLLIRLVANMQSKDSCKVSLSKSRSC